MAVVNRTLDTSEQYKVHGIVSAAVATGVTLAVAHVAWPCTIKAAEVAAFGVSNTFSGCLYINRFIVGSGLTVIALGTSFAPPAFGTSGVPASGVSLPAVGSSLLNLQANDVITFLSAGSNAAVNTLSLQLVLQPTQDIRTYFGGLA